MLFYYFLSSYKIKMVDTNEEVSATEPVSATEQRTKFIWSPKGKILALESVSLPRVKM